LLGAASAALPALRIVRLEVAAALGGGLATPGLRGETAVPAGVRFVSATNAAGAPAPDIKIWLRVPKADPHLLRQIAVVTRMGLATLGQRWKGALSVVVALTVVTLVMNPLLILMDSFRSMMAVQGSPMRVMITQPDVRLWRLSRLPTAWT